jgi:hypothetical protein
LKRPLLFLIIAALACGKRGDPRPPVPMIPKATSDLLVTQRANKLVLSWSYPSLTTAGKSLPAIRRITVYRYVEELPPQPTAAGSPPTAAQFAKLSQRLESIESANLPAATVGAKLVYEDAPALHSTAGRPLRITYSVVTEGVSARSEFSNLAWIIPLDVAVPPAGLAAAPKAEGVTLTWAVPTAAATGAAKPEIAGYNIYRTGKGEALDQFAVPVNPSPVQRVEYTDVPPYGTYDYRVTAVAAAGPPRIESEMSAPVTATFKDLVPPPPPASVTALIETKVVRLVWDPVDVPDLAGYNVYRTEAAARIKFTYGLPIKQTHFGDESIEPGIEYYYSITAVDTSGNESAEAKTKWIMVPKTP